MVTSTTANTNDTVTLGTLSASGTCFYLKDVASGTAAQAGTFYGSSSACADTAAGQATAARW
jgi:hypothetical protein